MWSSKKQLRDDYPFGIFRHVLKGHVKLQYECEKYDAQVETKRLADIVKDLQKEYSTDD